MTTFSKTPRTLKRVAHLILDGVGLDVPTLSLLQTFQRPEWLLRSDHPIPGILPHVSTPEAVTPQDVELCQRLINAYCRASSVEANGCSAIWLEILSSHYGPLIELLDKNDAPGLARLLGQMFHQPFMFGLGASAPEMKPSRKKPLRLHHLGAFNFLSHLTSVAEFVGVERTEIPDQGRIGIPFRDGASGMVARLEQSLGVSLNAPKVGAPVGMRVGDALISIETPEHLYYALRALQILDAHCADSMTPARIVEIGAGYGGAARWILKLRPDVASYRIIDLPTTNILQGYYLSKTLGAGEVSFLGEAEKRVHICPPQAIQNQTESFDLLLNENSMPEMPQAVAGEYLSWAAKYCRVFYSYNHEAITPATPQTLVPEIVRQVGGFRLLTRARSWLRRGYVEEVYAAL